MSIYDEISPSDEERANMSMAQIVARLSPEEQELVLQGFDPETLKWDWTFWGRPSQMPPEDDSWRVGLFLAGRGAGKLLCMDTPIWTPDGFKPISDIQDGDIIYDESGRPATVVQAHTPEIPERMYRITFSDGSTLLAGGEHQWVTWTHADRKSFNRADSDRQKVINDTTQGYPTDWPTWTRYTRWGVTTGIGPKIRNTDEIADTFRQGSRGDLNHSIPTVLPLQNPTISLPIDPYLLGMWLGDGDNRSGHITAHKDDLPHYLKHFSVASTSYDSRNENVVRVRVEGLTTQLRALGLLNNKHIPEIYLHASVEQRQALLAGLMDSDGSAAKSSVEFCTTDTELAKGVLLLVRTLGEKPVMSCSPSYLNGTRHKDRYRLRWRPTHTASTVFRLPRKLDAFRPLGSQALRNYHRMVTKIERITPVLSRCLTVDSPNSMYLAGESLIPTHNTRAAAEWIRTKARENRYGTTRFLLVARTAADLRTTIVKGDSGILAVSPPSEMPTYNSSRNELVWPNGAVADLRTAEEPDGLRGVQAHYSWADELAAWRQTPDKAGMTSWGNLRVATRLGSNPQIFATTTPKRVQVLKDLLKQAEETGNVWVTRGSTMDNAGNLAMGYIDDMLGTFSGGPQERQELYGEMLDEQEGALWQDRHIDAAHVYPPLPQHAFKVIGVDPSVAENPRDSCGIVVCASTMERELYRRKAWVLDDRTVRGKPEVWQKAVVEAAHDFGNAPIIVETNQGGAMHKQALLAIDPTLRIFTVHAKHGKQLRAEPIITPYEQNRVFHIDTFADLETEMTTWDPEFTSNSPDRIDALVHALTALLIDPPKGMLGGTLEAKSFAAKKMTLGNVAARNSKNAGGSRGFRIRGFN